MPDITIGIDLGTTYSLAAHMAPEGPKVLAGPRGGKLIPSVVAFDEQGRPVVGEDARQRQADNPCETIFSVKRLMGKGMAELGHALELYPYQVEEAQRELVKVRVGEKSYTPQEISSFILKEVKARAEEALGQPVANAVITVPAYFDDAQRQATRDAGRIAGLEVLRIVNEPTAAALAYGMDRKPEGRIAVYDLGGGTFDLSILHVEDGVFKVLATSGDTFLGGDDFDHQLVQRAAGEIKKRHGVDALADHKALTRLKNAAERAKIALSTADATAFEAELGGSVGAFRMEVTRAEFERATQPLMDRTLDACRAALADAKLTPGQIDEVILVGGSTRMFMVKPQVGAFFGRTPHSEIDPDEVVAQGAAVQAHILTGGYREILLLDVIPLSLGLETVGGAASKLILRNSPIPCTAAEYFTTFVDNQTGIDFNIVQGERELAKDCRSLGKFKLSGIPPMVAGMAKVEVKFTIDANGILKVSALEITSGREATVQVTPSHGLTDEEVERMIVESIDKAEEDFSARKLVEARTEATRVIHVTRKSLSEARTLISEEQARKLERAVEELERAMESGDADRVMSAMDEVNHLGMPLAEAMMNQVAQKVLKDRKVADL